MSALVSYRQARIALADITRVDQALSLRDECEHVKLYARQVQDRTLMADATEIQMRAERRLGDLLKLASEAGQIKPGRPSKQGEKNPSAEEGFPRVTLGEAGISHKLSAKAQHSSTLPDEVFETIVREMHQKMTSGSTIIIDPLAAAKKEARDTERRAQHASRTEVGCTVDDLQELAASGFKAAAMLIDIPWHFPTYSSKGEGRSAGQHYNTARHLDSIIALPVAELAAPDCALFAWIMDWDTDFAMICEILAAWGFVHKTTAFTWVKLNPSGEGYHMGQGYWTRANPEICLLATRGQPKRLNADVRQLVVSPVMEHSRKPDEIHDRIERLVAGPYLELYARRPRRGWRTWGEEIPRETFQSPIGSSESSIEQWSDLSPIEIPRFLELAGRA